MIFFARHYATGQPLRIECHAGMIASIDRADGQPAPWVAPALVDLQINGYAGVDFQSDEIGAAALGQAIQALHRDGCGWFLLTLITDDWEKMLARLRRLRALKQDHPRLARSISGWHIEGPFLSEAAGFCGAHNPKRMRNPELKLLEELREAAGGDLLLLTLAPERPGALDAIRWATAHGMRVSLGHTNAPAATLQAAWEAGARGFTHLGNACPKELDRHDNILWRVLDGPPFTASLIPDGIHVSPMFFRIVHRLLGPERISYTTDAMAAAGAPPGRYPIGDLLLEVGPDQVVRPPGKNHFAGSALRPAQGIARAARMLGVSWRAVWPAFSEIPARWLGISRELKAGNPATFCLIEAGPDEEGAKARAYVEGESAGEFSLATDNRCLS